jgi:RNA polymerase sigma-70 factor (ECF subfamily)
MADPRVVQRADADVEREWVARIRAGDERAFEAMFAAFYAPLVAFAHGIVRSQDAAEELVQDVFAWIWEARAEWRVDGALATYLYRAARNRALNHARHGRIVDRAAALAAAAGRVLGTAGRSPRADDALDANDIAARHRAVLGALPPRCREAYVLNRQHGLPYPEIARVLGVSVKAVEALLGRALKVLRAELL